MFYGNHRHTKRLQSWIDSNSQVIFQILKLHSCLCAHFNCENRKQLVIIKFASLHHRYK